MRGQITWAEGDIVLIVSGTREFGYFGPNIFRVGDEVEFNLVDVKGISVVQNLRSIRDGGGNCIDADQTK